VTRLTTALAALAALATGAPSASADRVVPKKGAPVRGYVSRTDTEVLCNTYRSKIPLMTYGVVRFPADQVKRVEEEVVPEEVVRAKWRDFKPDDADARVGVAKYAASAKCRLEAARLLEEAIRISPDHAEALALYGGRAKYDEAKVAEAKRGNPALDADLLAELGAYLESEDGAARAKEAKRIEAARAFPAKAEVLERMWRSRREPKGSLREDVPITLRSDKHPGGVYTIYVPDTYDPRTPIPLVLALHGGGAGGKDGREVVGNGRDASSLYIEEIRRRRWILVCPNALQAPWAAPPNEPFLLSLLEEIQARYNVDLDRVYLTGHSMGGFGTWWLGPRQTDVFAAIGPSAGGGGGPSKDLVSARTGVYVYHSSDDSIVNVASDQQAAKALLDQGADVVYLQLEDRGHSFPVEAAGEMFDFFDVKRLHAAKRASDWPRSSFARKVSKDEAQYLGDPAAAWAGPVANASLKDLLRELERGGGGAERAAAQIAATKPEGAAKAVAKVLKDAKATDDARAYAARCLGDLKDPSAAAPLADVVSGDAPPRLVRESAVALRKLASPSVGDELGRAVMRWGAEYGQRLQGAVIDYPDWEVVCLTLADLVEAYAVCGPVATAATLVEKNVVRLVLEKRERVDAAARAGQDASVPRTRLAYAVARAYATLRAPASMYTTLRNAVAGDEAAVNAVTTGRDEPFQRPETVAGG
jgi:hypothetical protein